MVTVLGLLGVLAVLFVTAVVATRSDPLLAEAPPDRPDLDLPDGPLAPADVAEVRFSLAVRGYRMSEVDAVLARLAAELAERDRRIAELQAEPGSSVVRQAPKRDRRIAEVQADPGPVAPPAPEQAPERAE